MKYSAVVVAAGRSTRFGTATSKMLHQFSDGQRVIDKALAIFKADPDCVQIVAVVNQEVMAYILQQDNNAGHIVYCLGGDNRCDSVYNGLMAVSEKIVLVHDGARCFLSSSELTELKKTMETERAAILALPETDTIKRTNQNYITSTIDRATLCRAQTPQSFYTQDLLESYHQAQQAGFIPTDEASVMENFSTVPIRWIEGKSTNIKITTPADVAGR